VTVNIEETEYGLIAGRTSGCKFDAFVMRLTLCKKNDDNQSCFSYTKHICTYYGVLLPSHKCPAMKVTNLLTYLICRNNSID